ncbi:hypothetical protein D3C75_1186240 [compost metagenome]
MVTGPVTVLQLLPPLLETSRVPAAAVSVPRVALSLLRLGVKLMSLVEILLMATVNWA